MERKSQHLTGKEPKAKLKRTAWLATTALTALLFHPGQLLAQPALSPTTTPQGGVVVAGSSTIAQNTGSTTITQTSASTVINWQSFNVGGNAQVTFAQPSSSAIALNRVVTATPSIIAGKINANGQIVLVNQSGVVFTKGSQVNAESIVVSTSNISNADFMAGHLVFSGAPNPGAKIVNNGTLTAREAGLVGLVAPQVANNGVITAQLGQVVLAGASAFTLDLYGDRLISLDVTQAVRAVDVGGKTVPALVTNRGLILADGGKITLTAQDADALVTQLINAGGTIRANTVGSQSGTVTIQGVGGNIQIAGNLLAQGAQSGSKGGAIEALTNGTVSVAAGAVIDASGNAGGGVVALGTDLQRATAGAADTTSPRAAAVSIASTAVVKADATGRGNGGKITLLSAQETNFAGTISTQGGTLGGNGGEVEISSAGVINLSGTVFDTAIDGQAGEILLDPATLVIGTGTPAAATSGTTTIGGFTNSGTSYIDPASLNSLAGTIVLEAGSLITVSSAINLTGASALSLVSNGAVSVGASISLAGSLEIDAAGTMDIDAGLTAGNITLKDNSSGTIGIDINAPITAGTLVALQSGGGINETPNGLINAPTLASTGNNGGDDVLSGANTVSVLGSFSVTPGGELIFTDTGSLSLTGPISAPSATLMAGTIGVTGDVSVSGALALEANSGGITESGSGGITAGTLSSGSTTIDGDVSLASTANSIGTLGAFTASGNILLDDSTALNIAGLVITPDTLTLEDSGAITEQNFGTISVATLSSGGATIGGNVSLAGTENSIGALADFILSGTHALTLVDSGALDVAGTVTAGAATLDAATLTLDAPLSITNALTLKADGGGITEGNGGSLTAGTLSSGTTTIVGNVSLAGTANSIGTLGAFAASGNILLDDTKALNISGLVTTPDALTLEDSSAVTEQNFGTISVATLSSGATTIGGAVSLGNNNTIGALGAFAASGNILLENTGTLDITGLVATPDALTLEDSGAVTEQTGGTINAATLGSNGTTIGGDVSLAGTANSIGTLAGFILSGTHALTLVDSGALDVVGTVTAGAATLDAATLTLNAPLSITNALTLEASSGGISEGSGSITAATLSSGNTTISGTVALGNANDIGTLGAFAASGDILLNDTGALDISGLVTTRGMLTLEDGGAVTELTGQNSGTLNVATLSSGSTTIGGAVSLGNANTIGTLGAFAASGNILLDDTTALNIAGLVSTPDALTLEDSGAVIEQNFGTISVATLSSGGTTIGGTVSLGNTNTIGALGAIAASGNILLDNTGTLNITGLVTTPDALTLEDSGAVTEQNFGTISVATLSSGGTTIGGAVSFSNTNTIGTLDAFAASGNILLDDRTALNISGLVTTPDTLTLEDSGAVAEQNGGTINAATLSSGGTTIGGDVSLAGTENSIGALADFILSGTHALTLVDSGALDVVGTVTAGAATLDAATLTLDAPLSVINALTLEAGGGGITESSSGSITAGTLSSGTTTIGRDVSLASTANTIGTLGAFAASGNILLDDSTALNISGFITTPGTLTLEDSGAVTEQNGGTISAATLSSGGTAIGGNVSLAGTENSIGTLADFILSGTHALTLVDSGALDIAGTVSAGTATLDAATLTLAAPLSITNALALEAGSGGITETSSGTITAGTLSSGGTAIGGDVSLAGTANSIGTLGGFTLSGTHALTLVDSGALDVAGSVSAGAATLDAAGLTLDAPLSITNALILEASSGGITEGTGSITAGTLSSGDTTIGGTVALGNANDIGTLGAFAASGDILLDDTGALNIAGLVTTPGRLTLDDTGALDIAGTVTAGAATLDAATLTLDAPLSITNALALEAGSGGITEGSTGTITAGTLSSGGTTVGGAVSLAGTENSIGVLGGFTLSGTHALTLVDSGTLNVEGTLTAGAATLDATGMTLNAPLSITAALMLEAGSGGVTEGNGSIAAGTLSSGTTTIGGTVALGNANDIGTLGAFAASGDILLDDTGALNIAGLVTTPGMLTLENGGAVTEQTGGTLNVATLSSGGTAIGGDVSLASAENSIGTLGGFTLSGTHALTLVDNSALDVSGTVSAGAATLDAAGLTLDAPLSITHALALEAGSGGITEDADGSITAGTLSSGNTTIGGTVALGSANSIATLGTFAASGDILLDDTGTLNVAGLVTAPSVTLSAGSIAVQNDISTSGALSLISTSGIDITGTADAGTFLLQASGNVSDSGGTIAAGTLTTGAGSISGNAVLTGSNTVAQLGSFTVGGNLSLANTGSLLLAASVQASTVWLADQGTVTLGAPATATAGQVTLAVNGLLAGGGSIGASGGTISITPYTSGTAVDLGGTAVGGLELSGQLVSELDTSAAVISITTTGSMFTEGALAFANPALVLSAGGPLTQTGTLSGDVIELSGSSLTLDGMLTATSLNLASPGAVTQAGSGVLAVGTLSSGTTTIGGAVALDGTANAIATLGAFAGAQNFTLDDGAALTVNGPLRAANIALTDGSSTASSIALDGTLTAGSGGRIDLVANRLTADGASLLAPGGTVAITPYSSGTAIDLGGTATGLDLSSALLAAIGSSTSVLDINTTGNIAADGAVTVTARTLSLSGNGIAFNGVLDLPGAGVLELASTNGVTTEAGETLTASTLLAGGAIIGPVNMAAGTNNIGRLGAMAVSGTDNNLALHDAGALDVTGPVSAGNISLDAAGLTITNTVAAATAVTLDSSNGIAETGSGLINAPSLSSGGATITGLVDLAGANTIATLNGFLSSGDLLLNDTGALTLAGNVSGANITLSADGLNFGGTVNTQGQLALSSAAGISQQSGTIGATLLTSIGTIGGAVDLTAAGNAIQTLGAFAATRNFTLEGGTALTLNGPLNAANVTLGAAGIALDGEVSTGTLQLASSAGVSEGSGGQVNAALLTTGNAEVTGDAVLNNAGNEVAALDNFEASGGLTLNDAAALSLTGPVTLGGTLALLDPNGITQTGGSITAAALTSDGGTIGGNAVFNSGANAIPVVGNFAATGDISITDAGALSLQGNINAGGALNLNAGGAITQNGGVIFAPLLNTTAPSITLTDANNIAALGNISAGGNVNINGVNSLTGQLTANNATLSAPGGFTLSGGAEINGALDIAAAGNIDQTSGSVNAQTATISAADITLSGTTAIADQLDLAAAGNITHAAGVLSAGTLVGSAGQLASFAASTDFGTLGSFIMQDSLFSLKNAGALIITGPVVANAISITAAGMVTLLGSTEGGLFITGSIAPDQTTRPQTGDSVITVTPGANGAAPEIVQTGTFLINAGPNAAGYLGTASQPATLFLNTTPNGTINFANYPDGLYAPSVDLILSAGEQGTISGNVNLQHIEITSALSTELTGSIDNVVGPTAAGNGSAAPFPQPNFRFNTCPIGSVNCMIVPIETLPAGNPLENFDISSRKHKQLHRNVQLPGIATRDF